MTGGRLLTLLIALGVVAWLVRSSHLLTPSAPEAGVRSPADRARAAARASDSRSTRSEAASRDLDSSAAGGGGSVSENMTTEQVRALLGPPDDVAADTTDSGAPREKWTYRREGKTVVFENGIVVRIE